MKDLRNVDLNGLKKTVSDVLKALEELLPYIGILQAEFPDSSSPEEYPSEPEYLEQIGSNMEFIVSNLHYLQDEFLAVHRLGRQTRNEEGGKKICGF